MEYKGIPFSIRLRPGRNAWAWTISPPNGTPPIEGNVKGRRELAIIKVQDTIDKWLKNNRLHPPDTSS
jgi:hypothetical protein